MRFKSRYCARILSYTDLKLMPQKAHGASAVLLMCSVLGKEIGDFIEHCNALHIECLVETRDKKEIELAQESGAIIIGINNRNLKTMQVELTTALSLRQYIDPGKIAVAESGIRTREDFNAG